MVSTGVLVFDGRCGFCTRSVGWLRRLDRGRRVDLVPLQQPGAPARVGATVEECLAAVHWQRADGSRAAAAEAINAALAAALGSRAPVFVYRVTWRAQEWLYQWVANNRYRLPGATPWCERYPADCTAASRAE
jgi:predicted DCC family thiol-disulfide oxidoreductase YuxK